VEKNGPANLVDIQEGDIILKINGTEVNSVAELHVIFGNTLISSKLIVVLLRDAQSRTVNPVVTEMPNLKVNLFA